MLAAKPLVAIASKTSILSNTNQFPTLAVYSHGSSVVCIDRYFFKRDADVDVDANTDGYKGGLEILGLVSTATRHLSLLRAIHFSFVASLAGFSKFG
ncbi:hypothetical protein H6F77_19350 [Microcoleus sp. FACHB-831]|uniref:hypothetical protein n=1 Tax=Microcoleus sp. FACHB-831 TaxID=2692827 RepID=UPI001685C845|nr:hypothetical protein [Microcoleus sp. FACHB-831]MBD1923211.1 hypothetical protein [Microcoleus sp. FACHB-831]